MALFLKRSILKLAEIQKTLVSFDGFAKSPSYFFQPKNDMNDQNVCLKFNSSTSGSALLLTIMVVSLLLMITLGFTVFVRLELRNVNQRQDLYTAQKSARLGVEIAIAQLQITTGPDQRVTAPATILDNSLLVDQTQQHRVGVWDTSEWSPYTPQTKGAFLGWLSSSADASGALLSAPDASAVESPMIQDVELVGLNSVGSNQNNWIWGEKIPYTSGGRDASYAFAVIDEGVKAKGDLARLPNTNTSQNRFRNFTSPSGMGIENMAPFLSVFSEEQREALDTKKVMSLSQLSFASADVDPPERFSQELFHDLTLYSQGLLTDTRSGGLKEDLNLLFEMSDEDYFASEYGDNAPEGTYASDFQNTPVENRHNHRLLYILGEEDFPFTINNSNAKLFGPSFATLRQHYLSYQKTQVDAAGIFSIETDRLKPYNRQGGHTFQSQYSFESDKGSLYNFKSNYWKNGESITRFSRHRDIMLSPVVLRQQMLFSTDTVPYTGNLMIDDGSGVPKPATHKLILVMSPVVVLWNPYDVAIDFQAFTVHLPHMIFPIRFDWQVDYDGNEVELENNPFRHMMIDSAVDDDFWGNLEGPKFSYGSETGVRLLPGEVKVLGMNPGDLVDINDNSGRFDLVEGHQGTGGLVATRLLSNINSNMKWDYYDNGTLTKDYDNFILLNADTKVSFRGTSDVGNFNSSRFFMYSYLVHPGKYNQRFSVSSTHRHNSNIQAASVPTFNNDGIGDFGHFPDNQDLNDTFAFNDIRDRREFGVFDLRVRAADETDKPSKLFGTYNPSAWVLTYRWVDGGNDRSMPGPYTLEATRLENGQFDTIEHDVGTARGYWGGSYSAFQGSNFVSAYQMPKAPLLSLGALQHVNGLGTFSFEPSHAIGNSFASPHIESEQYIRKINKGSGAMIFGDLSYLSNTALWDRYFFSSLAPEESAVFSTPRTLTQVMDDIPQEGLPNPRMQPTGSFDAFRSGVLELGTDPDPLVPHWKKPARFLTVDGAFNINSTSEEAWTALLTSLRGENLETVDPVDGQTTLHTTTGIPFPRSTMPVGPQGDVWRGFRELTDIQIQSLAEEIVKEVKARGPFMSLADFVNRSLVDTEQGTGGVLQVAIDRAGINTGFTTDEISTTEVDDLTNPAAASGAAAQGASAFLTQADLLQTLAPVITPRSDTFKIRAYGEVGNGAKAWCEAIVQRVPEYIDPEDSPWALPQVPEWELKLDPTLTPEMSVINQRFGRRYRIVSFRWLSQSEI